MLCHPNLFYLFILLYAILIPHTRTLTSFVTCESPIKVCRVAAFYKHELAPSHTYSDLGEKELGNKSKKNEQKKLLLQHKFVEIQV